MKHTVMDHLAMLQLRRSEEMVERWGRLAGDWGLALSREDLRMLAEERTRALRASGRVEYGEGILPRLILAFRDSPSLDRENCARTLAELQEEFYLRKNDAPHLTDDQLLARMRREFDHRDREEAWRQDFDAWYGEDDDDG